MIEFFSLCRRNIPDGPEQTLTSRSLAERSTSPPRLNNAGRGPGAGRAGQIQLGGGGAVLVEWRGVGERVGVIWSVSLGRASGAEFVDLARVGCGGGVAVAFQLGGHGGVCGGGDSG